MFLFIIILDLSLILPGKCDEWHDHLLSSEPTVLHCPRRYCWVRCPLILLFVRIGVQPYRKLCMYPGGTLRCAVYYIIDHSTDQTDRACPATANRRGVVCSHDVR